MARFYDRGHWLWRQEQHLPHLSDQINVTANGVDVGDTDWTILSFWSPVGGMVGGCGARLYLAGHLFILWINTPSADIFSQDALN